MDILCQIFQDTVANNTEVIITAVRNTKPITQINSTDTRITDTKTTDTKTMAIKTMAITRTAIMDTDTSVLMDTAMVVMLLYLKFTVILIPL